MTATRGRPAPGPAGGVDPRIRARRIEVRRQQARRRLRVLLALVLAAALAGLAYAAANSALLDVDEVVVEGSTRTPPADVVVASGFQPGDPLVLLDVDRASAAVARLPWVASATVDRSLAGTVTIEVVERVPVAALPVAGSDRWVLVDAEGRQLEQVPDPGAVGLQLRGVEASGEPGTAVGAEARSVLRLLDALTPPVRAAVSALQLEGGELALELAQGGTVRLGDTSQLDEKLVALETMLARVDLRCLGELDLGVPSAPALTRVPPSEGDQGAPLSDLSECP